jgi:choline dehydrogenase-like flavoprotein
VRRAPPAEWLPLSQAFHAACTELGYGECPDMNRPDVRGVGPIPINYQNSIRYSTAVSYLIPNRPRANLCVMSHAHVTARRFVGQRARRRARP